MYNIRLRNLKDSRDSENGNVSPSIWKSQRIATGVVARICGIIAIGAIVPSGTASAQTPPLSLAQERAAAQKAGLVLSAEALSAPVPPASENAAPLYQKCETAERSLLASDPHFDADEKALEAERRHPSSLTAADWPQVDEALKRRSDQIALIRKAAKLPKCVFRSREYVVSLNGADAISDIYEQSGSIMGRVEGLITAESIWEAHSGNPQGAIDDAICGLRAADHVGSHNNLIGHLTSINMDAVSLSGFRFVLRSNANNPAICRGVESSIRANLHYRPLSEMLKVEAGISQSMIDSIASSGPEDLGGKIGKPKPEAYKRMVDEFAAFQLREIRRCIAIVDARYAIAAPQLHAIADDERSRYPEGGPFPSPGIDWSQVVFTRDTIANVESTTCAAAFVLAYHATNGRFPAKLAAAMPNPPSDAFDGKPLHYEVTPAGFVISASHQRAGHKPEVASFAYPK